MFVLWSLRHGWVMVSYHLGYGVYLKKVYFYYSIFSIKIYFFIYFYLLLVEVNDMKDLELRQCDQVVVLHRCCCAQTRRYVTKAKNERIKYVRIFLQAT